MVNAADSLLNTCITVGGGYYISVLATAASNAHMHQRAQRGHNIPVTVSFPVVHGAIGALRVLVRPPSPKRSLCKLAPEEMGSETEGINSGGMAAKPETARRLARYRCSCDNLM